MISLLYVFSGDLPILMPRQLFVKVIDIGCRCPVDVFLLKILALSPSILQEK